MRQFGASALSDGSSQQLSSLPQVLKIRDRDRNINLILLQQDALNFLLLTLFLACSDEGNYLFHWFAY